MANESDENDVYVIPPNFVEGDSILGGTVKLRNAIEACVLSFAIAFPIFKQSFSITTKIIIICFTVLPVGIFAVIGISGESLTQFIINFLYFIFNRRVLGKISQNKKAIKDCERQNVILTKLNLIKSKVLKSDKSNGILVRKQPILRGSVWIRGASQTANYLPIDKIDKGIIMTKDRRYIKIIEIAPINFLLRSSREQKNIIYSFISYLKICPVKVQIKVLTRQADTNRHLRNVHEDILREKDEKCRELQFDYERLVRQLGSREAITRRFFLIFEYEPFLNVNPPVGFIGVSNYRYMNRQRIA